MITLNNASNNGTIMDEITEELKQLEIPFDIDGNRIRIASMKFDVVQHY